MRYVNVYIHNLGRLWSHIEQHVMGFLSNKNCSQGGLILLEFEDKKNYIFTSCIRLNEGIF